MVTAEEEMKRPSPRPVGVERVVVPRRIRRDRVWRTWMLGWVGAEALTAD
jgi:hypothetical protein